MERAVMGVGEWVGGAWVNRWVVGGWGSVQIELRISPRFMYI